MYRVLGYHRDARYSGVQILSVVLSTGRGILDCHPYLDSQLAGGFPAHLQVGDGCS
jgi:hypothetical protein